MKKILFPLFTTLIILTSCASPKKEIIKLEGNAQGTSYHITYLSDDGILYKKEIDSLLHDIDGSMSTWIPNSIISRINNNEKMLLSMIISRRFLTNLLQYLKKQKGILTLQWAHW
ncbi:FAD:protein FMN transferase [Flavobacterium sp. ACAM 123]|uniref:FAD:protein FMN transferase n=1 Tax=Flavobacterium sp. ACAM 123 TaxID=1189620 RepID=UPI0002E7B091|nr:FAD:protein FMN transferase [Flavobacterium sp. ACAM 123]